jgi:hypothetical protein
VGSVGAFQLSKSAPTTPFCVGFCLMALFFLTKKKKKKKNSVSTCSIAGSVLLRIRNKQYFLYTKSS